MNQKEEKVSNDTRVEEEDIIESDRTQSADDDEMQRAEDEAANTPRGGKTKEK